MSPHRKQGKQGDAGSPSERPSELAIVESGLNLTHAVCSHRQYKRTAAAHPASPSSTAPFEPSTSRPTNDARATCRNGQAGERPTTTIHCLYASEQYCNQAVGLSGFFSGRCGAISGCEWLWLWLFQWSLRCNQSMICGAISGCCALQLVFAGVRTMVAAVQSVPISGCCSANSVY